MAFNMAAAGAAPQNQQAPDAEELSTELLGFHSISGDTKLKLLPSPWPQDGLPPPTSSLLAVASTKGLLAAAGPSSLIISSTEAIRQGFKADITAEGNVKSFTPQLTIDVPRLSQLAFTSDEEYLVICAHDGGGLAVYETQALIQGSKQPAFQIGTNGIGVRSLIPNPASEFATYVAVVLENGHLVLADLVQKELISGKTGQVLREGVSCCTWSTKGKQLIAGLGNGSAVQMMATGDVKAEIPRPQWLEGDHHIASISWLANDDFLIIYDPTSSDSGDPCLFLVQRQKGTHNFAFSKMLDPCMPMDQSRGAPHYFTGRLKSFPPSIEDLLVLSSTCSSDIGMITKSTKPLTSDMDGNTITNNYVTTSMAIDSRRAQLPMSAKSGGDTFAIGLALDLSSREKVPTPIPGDEMSETASPLPGVLVLNHEGVLNYWWVVYNDSIRQNTPFPGLVAAQAQAPSQTQPPASPVSLGGMGTGSALGGMGKPAAPAFGASTFGTAGGSSFGGASALGSRSSPWASTSGTSAAQTGGSAFGQPAFGSTSSFGASKAPAFGSTGGLGSSASPWGSATANNSQSQSTAPAFGAFGSSQSKSSPFAGLSGASQTTGSSFGSSSNANLSASPFGTAGQQTKSAFGNPSSATPSFGMSTEPSFGSTVTVGSAFSGGSTQKSLWGTPNASAFGKPSEASGSAAGTTEMTDADPQGQSAQPQGQKPASFGLGSGGFKLGSTFKPDETASQNEEAAAPKDKSSLFGTGFGAALSTGPGEVPSTTPIKPEPGSTGLNLEDIPVAPAQEQGQADSPVEAEAEPAPLPPDPKPAVPSAPPAPATDKAMDKAESDEVGPEAEAEPAPLPPSPQFATPAKPTSREPPGEQEPPPLAGSPPIQVHAPQPSDVSSRTDEIEEGEDEEDFGESEELEAPDAPLPPDPSSLSGDRPLFGQSPLREPRASSPPRTAEKTPQIFSSRTPAGFTPAGFPKGAPILPPPTFQPQGSPRSPSPVRSTSAPQGRQFSVQPSKPISRQSPTPRSPPSPELEEVDLTDEEADRIQEELDMEIVGSKELAPFIAHQDYAGPPRAGLAGQIERVYRDINSMVDTLGLNSRSLATFVKGHSEFYKDEGRERHEDLVTEQMDDWCLVELPDLAGVEDDMEQALDEGRVTAPEKKAEEARKLSRVVNKLRSRVIDLRKMLEQYKDPELQQANREAQLSAESQAQQKRLRENYNRFQVLLGQVEESLTILRVKVAAAIKDSAGLNGGRGIAVPTVEAVQNTILKMTAMIERKSGDIDLLESQMRKVRLGSPSSERASREGTPSAAMSPSASASTSRAGRQTAGLTTPAKPTPLRESSYGFDYGEDAPEELPRGSIRSMDEGRSWINPSVDELERHRRETDERMAVIDALKEAMYARYEAEN